MFLLFKVTNKTDFVKYIKIIIVHFRSFRTPLRLNVHMNYHMNIRNYQCGICSKKFVTSHMLKRHQLVHVTQKPYGCNYCEKKFKTSMLCKQHVRRVHKIESTLTVRWIQMDLYMCVKHC